MKVLCVAEKPSISKSITQILSGGRFEARNSRNKYIKNYDFAYQLPPPLGGRGDADFTVTAVLGHLTSSDFDDDHRRWQSCDPFALFDARIITQVSSDLKAVEKNLQQEARNADLLLIWTDCDREGEHIGSEVADVCRRANPRIRVKRARFSAIIAGQIHDACRNANDLDMRQAMAVEARIALDLRIGAAFTRFATMSLQARIPELSEQTISYGPCQFPTLGFVVDQYNKVQNFVSEPFWYINVAIERENEVDSSKTDVVEFKWRRNHLFDLEVVTALYENCVDEPMATVLSVDTKPTTKWKPLPLTTVELQQSGSRLLHMTPKRILDIAEKLYQKGFLSYPRTETDQYDKAFDFMSLIQKQTIDRDWGGFAARLIDGEFQRPRNGRKNDKAHPPIHPTAAAVNLEADERRVYELVTRRFLASCHSNAEGKQTTVEIEIAEEKFFTTGLVIIRRNYLEVYPYDKWSDSFLPDFQEGEQFIPSICELKDGKTTAPNLLTEADLVGLMDKNGIGTDATIAEHIAKIIERQYVAERPDGRTKYLVPSPLGIGLVEGFNAIGFDRSLSKPHLRAETEARMQLICDGARQKGEVLDATIDEYKEVYVKARREFTTVVDSVNNYMHGQGAEQEALRAAARGGRGGRGARGARGGRGGRGGGGGGGAAPRRRNDDDNADEDDSDGGGGPAGGGGAVRGGTRATRARGTTARGRSGRAAVDVAPSRRRTNGDQDDSTSAVPECACGSPAVPRTVSKPDSAHAGRGFWTCARPQGEQCGFFEWRDDDAPQAGPSRLSAPKRATSSRPAAPSRAAAADEYDAAPPRKRPRRELEDEEVTVRCDCGLEANFATVAKAGPNKGRSFWGCPNNPRSRCKFFEWADEADAPEPDRYASSSTRGRAGAKSARGKGKSRATGSGGGGPAGGGQTCYKCGEEGHWANSCPGTGGSGGAGGGGGWGGGGAGGGAGGSDQACFKCGQPGHWANACPGGVESSGPRGGRGGGSGPVDSGITECFKCGGTGHFANRCTNEGVARGRPAQKSTPGDGRTCFNCNGEGHWSSECTVKGPKGPGPSRGGRGGRATAGGVAGGSDDSCFKCGRPGHWASNCTNA